MGIHNRFDVHRMCIEMCARSAYYFFGCKICSNAECILSFHIFIAAAIVYNDIALQRL